MEFFQNLKLKPDRTKRLIALTSSLAITLFIAVGWISFHYIDGKIAENNLAKEKKESPVNALVNQFRGTMVNQFQETNGESQSRENDGVVQNTGPSVDTALPVDVPYNEN